MKDFLNRLRAAGGAIVDLWRDRDIHYPAFKEGVKQLPSRFKEADTDQKVYLIFILIGVILSQVYFVLS